ncbi:MAG: NADH-quinone oxidoreductase subunit L, partial [Candidatus Sulfotelmatobacter sp.]
MTLEDLEQIASEARAVKEKSPRALNVCVAAGCLSLHSDSIKSALDKEVQRTGANCRVRGTGCMGLCSLGPLVSSEPDGNLLRNVAEPDVTEIVAGLAGTMPERLLYSRDQPFFQRQTNIVLENSGRIDPEKIEEYIAADGYRALVQALAEMAPAQIVQEVSKSGLRGRGGAGYPTGLKWGTVAKTIGTTKYVICNADEGDPGAFMDRSVL